MEAATAPQRQPDQLTEEAALAALTVLILSDLTAEELGSQASALLAGLGIPAAAVTGAVSLLHPHLLLAAGTAAFLGEATDAAHGAAALLAYRTTPARHAAYLLQAARRLAAGGTMNAERRYLAQHLAAERARRDAATRVDAAAQRWGPVLGWYSILDAATTLGCRNAHGSNFRYTEPPLIEGGRVYPGQLHGGACRCRPGAPWPRAAVLA